MGRFEHIFFVFITLNPPYSPYETIKSLQGPQTYPRSDVAPKSRQTVFNTLRRWKQIDISITEAFNEAKHG